MGRHGSWCVDFLSLVVVLVNYCKYQRNIHSMGDEFGKEVSSVKHTTDKNRQKQTKTHKTNKKDKTDKKDSKTNRQKGLQKTEQYTNR